MVSFTNMSTLILVLLLYECDFSSSNKNDAQLSRTEKELVNLLEYILNLRKDLYQERIERKENIEALNRTIFHFKQDCQDNGHPRGGRRDFNESIGFGLNILEYFGLKKIKSLQRGLEREKALRIIAENRVDALDKKLQMFEDELKAHKAMVTDLDKNIGQVQANVVSLKMDMGNMASDIGSITTNVLSIKEVIAKSQQVAVSGLLKSTLTTFRTGQKIVFDDIYENLGNSYQTSTGVFTAPVAGLYIVLLAISSDHNPTPVVDVVRNGVTLCRTVMAVLSSWSVAPCTAVVHLNQGDQIWAQVSVLHYRSHTIRGDLHSSFSIGLFSPD